MRSYIMRGAACVSFALLWLMSFAPVWSDEPTKTDESLRQKRLKALEERLEQFRIETAGDAGQELARGKQPILRWSNPVREFTNDGITYLYFAGERPRAVVTVWARSPEANLESGMVLREFVSLAGESLTCRRGERVVWSPKTGGLVDQALLGSPAPAERPAQRLAQMRDLARRFLATTYKMDSPHELRLMTQPLYRYEDKAAGILDGALFAFAEGNDAEALLLLEATADGVKDRKWRYTLARMTSYRVVVRLDDREVFDAAPYWKGPRKPEDPYAEAEDGPFTLREANIDSPKEREH